MAENFRVQGHLGLDGSGFMRTLGTAQVATGRFASSVSNNLGNRLAGLFSLGAMGAVFRRTIDMAGRLVDMNSRTGASVENLQRYQKALKENGATLEDLIGYWQRLNVARQAALNAPGGAQSQAFQRLGVSATQLKTSSGEDLGNIVANAFKNAKVQDSMVAPLVAVGGRGVMQLAATFRGGLDQMNRDMQVMTTEQAIILDGLGDKFSTFGDAVSVKMASPLTLLMDGLLYAWEKLEMFGEAFVGILQSYITALLNPTKFAQTFKAGMGATKSQIELLEAAQAKRLADEKAALKRRADERNKPRDPLDFGPSADLKPGAKSISQIQSDSLLAVGNFLGAGRSAMENLASQQVQLLRRIADNTKQKAGTSDPFAAE